MAVGIRLPDDLVDLLPERDQEGAILYRRNCYEVTNQLLDQIAVRLAGVLQGEGYHAFPVPASRHTDDGEIRPVFSHKLAAHPAGLEWIGKSCLLATPDHGPRVRWESVLTDAPLKPSGLPMKPTLRRLHRMHGYLSSARIHRANVRPGRAPGSAVRRRGMRWIFYGTATVRWRRSLRVMPVCLLIWKKEGSSTSWYQKKMRVSLNFVDCLSLVAFVRAPL